MHARNLCLFLTLSALSICSVRAADPPAPAKPAPETAYARRSVYVPGVRLSIIKDMVAKAAIEHADIVGLSPDVVRERISVNREDDEVAGPDKRDEHVLIAVLVKEEDHGKPRANEFLDKVVSSLEDQLRDWHNTLADAARRKLDVAEERFKQALNESAALEAMIRDATGRVDASIDAIRATVPKLEDERQSIKLDVVGKQARQKALVETIAEVSKTAEARVTVDEVAAELGKIVEARIVRLKNIMAARDAAAVSKSDVADAEAAVAEAKARMLERREAVKQAAGGGDLLGALNRELAKLSIDAAESEARLAAAEKLLNKYGDAQGLLRKAETARREENKLDRFREQREQELRTLELNIPDPVLRVLSADSMPPGDPRLKPQSRTETGAPAPKP